MTEEKESRLTLGTRTIMLIIFFVSLIIVGISLHRLETNTKFCPICSHRFEYDDTQSKVVCKNCNYIMIFSVGDDE